jgi:RNA 2',3'-cyclic 3'-phosphodiesterase
MRLFIGVWLSEAMRQEVVNYIKLIQKDYTGFKWTHPDNLHFTLRFLGEVPSSRIKSLHQALQLAANHNESFQLRLGMVGTFPARGIPRIIWLGVNSGRDELVKLANSVETLCCQYDFPAADKPFKPHLTLARAKSDLPVIKISESEAWFNSETTVSGFSLIESQLFSGGPVYRTVETFNLGD